MGNEILSKYYEGIQSQLNVEVNSINKLFHHQGLKGQGNEDAIRNLVTKFIPKKYGVGSGIVIDQHGTVSKQSDIIIFDNHNYPELLSLTPVHMYPVDLVYATIEIKTTLDSKKSREAIENIKSVRSLNYIKDEFRKYPIDPVHEIKNDTVFWENANTIPPIGIVFAYKSNTKKFRTFANWFQKNGKEDTKHWPSHVFCLDQGVIIAPGWKPRKCFASPYTKDETFLIAKPDEIINFDNKEWVEYLGRFSPLSTINNQKILIDQSKLLLNFVTILSELLARKQISPKINFRETYLPTELVKVYEVKE
ncbi:MAG: DUF6602 domain-containing protein [Chloroflexota bacterium]